MGETGKWSQKISRLSLVSFAKETNQVFSN